MNNLQLNILERLSNHIECGIPISNMTVGVSFTHPHDLNGRNCKFSGPGSFTLGLVLNNIFTQ